MLVATVRDDVAGVEGLRVGHQAAQLVVVQEHHVFGIAEGPGGDELAADRDHDEPQAGVGALIDEEVVIGRERVHVQRERERAS